MTALVERDYFSDHSILRDPYAYFEAVREKGPVYRLPGRDIVVVTGHEEALAVLRDTENFSSAIAPQGPAAPLPFTAEGEDIMPQIEAHRTEFLGGDLLVAYDGQQHGFSRSILSRLFTPSKLKANEAFIDAYATELVGNAVANGRVEMIKDIATPFVTMVIADLLGVPEGDRQIFMDAIDAGPPPGSLDADDLMAQNQPLVIMGTYFAEYVMDRRESPRDDILTDLSLAPYPDGSQPDAMEIVRLATFLFGAGQDTSAKLLGNIMRFLVDMPELQQKLRENPALIPDLIEEVLRLEGSTKMTARLVRKATRVGDVDVAPGTKIFIALAAANRDPRRWDRPDELILGRPKAKEHVAFGRGAHVCAGAPLARVEVRVLLERILEMTSYIDLDESVHGPRGDRRLDYEPSFIIRGLASMELRLKPAAGFVAPAPKAAPAKVEAAAPSGPAYSTATTKLGVLLGDPAARAILDQHFPGMSTDRKIGMGKGMTLRSVRKFAPDFFSEDALDAVDIELAKLPG